MLGLLVRILVVDLLYLAQKAQGLHIRDADLTRILDYLQQERNEENNKSHLESKESVPDIQSLSRGQSGAYQTSQYSQDERENRALHDVTEDLYPEPNLEGLAKLLSHKSQAINTRIPKFNRELSASKNNDRGYNVHDYSKVYLVLDPRAKINNADLKGIGDIVSSIISANGKLNNKQKPKKQQRYKGFAITDDFLSRRRNRDSNEKFSKDSIERDYKPKRARNDYSRGAGRTAIPYIGHRADIYERE